MPNDLQKAGAMQQKPTKFAVLHQDRFITGLWTQRGPLRDAASPYIQARFYGSRYDSLIDGLNAELTTKLTLGRRPGHSLYNNGTFAAIDRFYSFRQNISNSEVINVLADTATKVIDITGPSGNTTIFNKSVSAGQTSFLSVGNTLYMADGIDQFQYDGTNVSNWGTTGPVNALGDIPIGTEGAPCRYWAPNMSVLQGYSILDSNGNVQLVAGSLSNVGTFSTSKIVNAADYTSKITFDATEWQFANFQLRTTGAATGSPHLLNWLNAYNFGFSIPSNASITGIAVDLNWVSQSSTTAQLQNVSLYDSGVAIGTAKNPNTQPSTSNSDVVLGSNTDTWGTTLTPALVNDPTFGFGIQIFAQTVRLFLNNFRITIYYTVANNSISVINGTTATLTGSTTPKWNTSLFGKTTDGGTVWVNCGPPSQWSPSTVYSTTSTSASIVDGNGNLQIVQVTGMSGTTQPTWSTTIGATTTDGAVTWVNVGPGNTAAHEGYQYVYAYHTTSGNVSTASPVSQATGPVLGSIQIPLTGVGSADPSVDFIWLFRTPDGGSSFEYLDQVANPGAGSTWTFTDTHPDSDLNEFLLAPISEGNDPPPSGITNLTYHLGRIWGSVGNTVYYSRTADSTAGSALQSFPPSNYFVFPSKVTRMWANALGLLVFTISDVYLIQGQGTASSPLYAIPYLQGIGLLNYNALDINGSIAYMFTSDAQLIAFDPNSGISEIGFPIGDILGDWNPANVYVTWHVSGSRDKALYVSDGSTGWYRMSPTTAPESGAVMWSPKANVTGGCSAVQSIEVSPGVKRLLVGPASSGPILKRDLTVWSDNGTPYSVFATFGSFVLAMPGQISEVSFIATDSMKVGTAMTLGVRLDEISGSFETMTISVPDPPQLVASSSVYGLRFYFNQVEASAWCRHLQVQVSWPSEAQPNELLSMTIFGASHQER